MNSTTASCLHRTIPPLAFAVNLILATLFSFAVNAQEVPHLTVPQPGGMPGLPVLTGIEAVTNGVRLTWDGPPGYYQVVRKDGITDGNWQTVGPRTNFARAATITGVSTSGFFKVSGPSPRYAGSEACIECHGPIHNSEVNTSHTRALETLKQINQDKNPGCLPCHTVGYGLPTGFISEAMTPRLAGVQCENCHGPAANHAANPDDPIVKPRVELAAEVCGGCHNGSHHPTYDEWKTSGHFQVVEDMNPSGRIDSCGRCHSGSVRVNLLKGHALPVGDANVGIGCAVCHDPHATNANPAQLRNPVASTNDYVITTSGSLAGQYNAGINICAQCHNHRGASWTSSGRPPHHSPQYNMLIGSVGLLESGAAPHQPGAHALQIEKQCVGCHMQTEESHGGQPALTGHSFRVEKFDGCLQCHPLPELLAAFTSTAVSIQIQQLKDALDLWAATKAPPALQTKYGAKAWEYSTAGELSGGGSGPSGSEQAQIPENIRKARFNLYIVYHDGSFGIHNGPHTISLLEAARNWIQQELNK